MLLFYLLALVYKPDLVTLWIYYLKTEELLAELFKLAFSLGGVGLTLAEFGLGFLVV